MGWLRGQQLHQTTRKRMLRRNQQIGGDEVHKVDRVLDVRQGELVWVAGTVYMEMPLKPNILDDISKHVKLTNECLLPIHVLTCFVALDCRTASSSEVHLWRKRSNHA
jgi:hypothetical protein